MGSGGSVDRGRTRARDAAAVVLAGGRSSRIGRPKPFLAVGRRELLQRALDTASATCRTVLLVVDDPEPSRAALLRYGWHRESGGGETDRFRRGPVCLRLVPDRRPGEGPLAGLETAWLESPDGLTRWWALASDLPFVSPGLGLRLLTALRAWEREGPAVAPDRPRAVVASAGGRLQPLCAAYGAGALPVARERLDRSERSLRGFLDRLEIRAIELGAEEGWRLLNVNTPADLERARARARRA